MFTASDINFTRIFRNDACTTPSPEKAPRSAIRESACQDSQIANYSPHFEIGFQPLEVAGELALLTASIG